jgi:hypothetical protein
MAKITVCKCNKCGTIYPADYYEQWGRKYGIGQGATPVCEALNSRYDNGLAIDLRHPERAGFPLENCNGTMSTTEMDDQGILFPVLAVGDEEMELRAPLMQQIQATKSPELLAHLTNVAKARLTTGKTLTGLLATLVK